MILKELLDVVYYNQKIELHRIGNVIEATKEGLNAVLAEEIKYEIVDEILAKKEVLKVWVLKD